MAGVADGGIKPELFKTELAQPAPAALSAEVVLAAQKRSLELVIQGAPVHEVLADLTRVVESAAEGGALAAVLILNAEGRLQVAAAPSLPPSFSRAVEALEADDLGAFGVAAVSNVTAVSQDIDGDPNLAALKSFTEQFGLKAAWNHPIVTRDNRVVGAFCTFFHEQRRPSALELRLVETLSQTAALAISRHESEAAMARQRRTLDLAMEAADMGSWRYTVADNICMYDDRSQYLYGLTDGRFLHDDAGVKRLIHPDDQAPMWAAVAIAVDPAGDGRYNVEYRVRQLDGSWRWLSAWGIVEFEGEGGDRKPVAIAGASRDISAIKAAEERQRLLINELNHRVKNTLATVQSIAYQTLKASGDPDTIRGAFDARLLSLARAHDLLTVRNWIGADLAEVVTRAIEPFSAPRFDVFGPALHISPKHALAFSMALHELATNASKHGALKQPRGRVRLEWVMQQGALTVSWQETGGQSVTPPSRRGFGSRLLEQSVARDLGGTARLDFAADGVRWQVTAPL